MIVAASEALRDDHLVWCIGDGPADSFVGRYPEMGVRLSDARTSHAGVETMFQAMLEDYRKMDYPWVVWSQDPSILLADPDLHNP